MSAHFLKYIFIDPGSLYRFVTHFKSNTIPHGVVGNISACHADARGSIPRGEAFCHVFLRDLVDKASQAKLSTYIPHGVVGNISACHADARGSIPRGEVFYFDKYSESL